MKFPTEHPILMLNGDGVGPINHLVVNNRVSRSYARRQGLGICFCPAALENHQVEKAVRDQVGLVGKTTETGD